MLTKHLTVIALVEYLTSEEAGRPLGKNFAWPVANIVNCSADLSPIIKSVALGEEAKANGNGYSLNGDANGHTNVLANGHANRGAVAGKTG